MRLASIGSGSQGNGTIVQSGDCTLLIDCGFSARETVKRLARLNLAAEDLTGILVTHEHADHISGVGTLARKFKLPVWLSAGTAYAAERVLGGIESLHIINNHEAFVIGELEVHPLVVPHDAREPCQYLFEDGKHRMAVVTDFGSSTPYLKSKLSALDALLLEFNHDEKMLANCDYPASTRRRIAGDLGHLSNIQAHELLASLDQSKLQHFVAAHLSERNNAESLVRHLASQALNCAADWIAVANQSEGLGWRELG